MNAFMAATIINIGLFILIGFAVYCTKSAWPLLGLVFVMHSENRTKKKEKSGEDKQVNTDETSYKS